MLGDEEVYGIGEAKIDVQQSRRFTWISREDTSQRKMHSIACVSKSARVTIGHYVIMNMLQEDWREA